MTRGQAWQVLCTQLLFRGVGDAKKHGWQYAGGHGGAHRFYLYLPDVTLAVEVSEPIAAPEEPEP